MIKSNQLQPSDLPPPPLLWLSTFAMNWLNIVSDSLTVQLLANSLGLKQCIPTPICNAWGMFIALNEVMAGLFNFGIHQEINQILKMRVNPEMRGICLFCRCILLFSRWYCCCSIQPSAALPTQDSRPQRESSTTDLRSKVLLLYNVCKAYWALTRIIQKSV